ncbi:MAG TPA: hypothetical protein VNJ11_11475 [Bryobacteraceae bacterium]|nr:hypothetical protein [Bryobacteraceae bacterium]
MAVYTTRLLNRVGAGALLIAALACGPRRQAGVSVHPALASLIPDDTVAVAVFRVEELKSSDVYRKWIAPRILGRLERPAAETGFDPRKDLFEAVVASNGKDVFVLARGRFAPERIGPQLERSGARRSVYKNFTLYGDPEAALLFLNRAVAAAGPPGVLRSLVDRPPGNRLPARLLEKMKAVPAASQIWAVALGPNPFGNASVPWQGNAAGLARLLESVESVWAGADLRPGLDMTVEWTCRTKNDAKLLHDALRGLIGMGRLSTPDNERDLLRFYDAIEVSQQEAVVRVRMSLSPELVDKFLSRMERHSPER